MNGNFVPASVTSWDFSTFSGEGPFPNRLLTHRILDSRADLE